MLRLFSWLKQVMITAAWAVCYELTMTSCVCVSCAATEIGRGRNARHCWSSHVERNLVYHWLISTLLTPARYTCRLMRNLATLKSLFSELTCQHTQSLPVNMYFTGIMTWQLWRPTAHVCDMCQCLLLVGRTLCKLLNKCYSCWQSVVSTLQHIPYTTELQ